MVAGRTVARAAVLAHLKPRHCRHQTPSSHTARSQRAVGALADGRLYQSRRDPRDALALIVGRLLWLVSAG